MLILDEKKYAEDFVLGRSDNVKSVLEKIGYITRYCLHELRYNDRDNYTETVRLMTKRHSGFDESCYSNLISDAIKLAHKKQFFHIDSIRITKSELEQISVLNNLREEKILFVLLCMAKQQSVSYGFTGGLVKYSLPDLCKEARVSVPSDEREYLLHDILTRKLIDLPWKNDTKCVRVNFIDDDSDIVLSLNEVDCSELAYQYLEWKTHGLYKKCDKCGRLIQKNRNKVFCSKCSTRQLDGDKVITCKDCGVKVIVDAKDNKTIRCKPCQHEADYTSIGSTIKICPQCHVEFNAGPKSKTDMCGQCYNKHRRQRKTEVMNALRNK